MIRSLFLYADGTVGHDLDDAALAQALKDGNGTIWLDFQGEPPEACQPILENIFGFHPLAVDDALRETHVPKLDDWDRYLYIVVHGLDFNRTTNEVDTLELDLFLGLGYLVTHHDQPIAAIDHVWSALQREPQRLNGGAVRLTYRLLDELVAGYLPAMEEIEDSIETLEDEIMGAPSPHLLERVFTLKRSLLQLRRILAPQREVLSRMARDEYAAIDASHRVFFRDIYDHLVRLYDISEGLRDVVNGAMEIYLSVVNNRMNEVMKTLTIITTVFMPLSFVTGFFGMNFFQAVLPLDAWTGWVAFGLTLAALLFIPIGMYLWMRRRALI